MSGQEGILLEALVLRERSGCAVLGGLGSMKDTLWGDGEGEAAPWGQEPKSPHSADRAEEQR